MNEIINKFLLAGDKFMLKMYLRHFWFTFSAFTKNKERILRLRKEDSKYIYKRQLNKYCFQHDDFTDLPKRTASNKKLRDKAFNIAKTSKI